MQGSIRFEGKRINGMAPHHIVRAGIAHVPEGRHVFPDLSVAENLEMGALFGGVNRPNFAQRLILYIACFPN